MNYAKHELYQEGIACPSLAFIYVWGCLPASVLCTCVQFSEPNETQRIELTGVEDLDSYQTRKCEECFSMHFDNNEVLSK